MTTAASGMTNKPMVPVGLVIFGASGDLTRRKLVPALYELAAANQLPDEFSVVGFARREWSDSEMRAEMKKAVNEFARNQPIKKDVLERLLDSMYYIPADFKDDEAYQRLGAKLEELNADNRMFYLATPPEAYESVIAKLGAAKLDKCPPGWTRIVVEKPYGRDLESARTLERRIHRVFNEDQIFRIDHYLGKETVQNILVFRFANGIFEPLWNRHNIDHIQITVAETFGVGTRAGYYDTAGVIRDIFQNHILQLLALTAMEAPVAFNARSVRDEKVKILQALRPLKDDEAVGDTFRAQYGAGTIEGKKVPGYHEESNVSEGSTTETLLALRLQVDNWRWAGVPIFIRSGKRMPRRLTEIAIHFKQLPLPLFGWRNLAGDAPNRLVLNIQPDEGITLSFGAKAPGPVNLIESVKMDFSYTEAFGGEPPEAYERLLMDCMNGDATLFTRSDEVLAAWEFTNNILEAWAARPVTKLPLYEAGTWGPKELDEFIGRHQRVWRNLD